MYGRLALLGVTLALTGCDQLGRGRRDPSPVDEFAARGERAFSRMTGRDDRYGEDRYAEEIGYDEAGRGSPYERGVRDGLRGARFDREVRSEAYARGYEAGLRERERDRGGDRFAEERPIRERASTRERVDTRERAAATRQAPRRGLRACIDEAERMWNLDQGAATAVNSRVGADGDYVVTIRAGQRKADCVLGQDGEIRGLDERRARSLSALGGDTRDAR